MSSEPEDGEATVAAAPARRRGRAAGLTKESIIEAALAVIDERGIEGLTMRRLGQALGVDAMAVYWHLDSKAAVLDAVVDAQAARLLELQQGPLPTDPAELMIAIAHHYRRVLLQHPNLAPILASRPLPQAGATILLSYGVSLLRAAGFADEDIPLVSAALANFGLGFALMEAATSDRRSPDLGQSFRDQQEGIRDQFAASEGDTSVEQAAVAHRLSPDALDLEFDRGLRAMLHGLRTGLGTRPPD